jgi:hypothetical protein
MGFDRRNVRSHVGWLQTDARESALSLAQKSDGTDFLRLCHVTNTSPYFATTSAPLAPDSVILNREPGRTFLRNVGTVI